MSDIELIIRIPEEIRLALIHNIPLSLDQKSIRNSYISYAIICGKPLPKGHGRLVDVDKIIKKMEKREEQLKDNRAMYETACVETALDMFGETIIEADKGVSE